MEGPYLILPSRNILAGSVTACRQPPECAAMVRRRSGYRRMAFWLVAVVIQAGHDLLRRSRAPAARSRTGPGSA